ncbi:MAG: acyl-CoA dehydrogenase family protein [Halobacteria archaeon]
MDFSLTPAQEALRRSARAFALREIAPKVEGMAEEEALDAGLVQKLKNRYAGMWFPAKYGGKGTPLADLAVVMEEIGAVNRSSALVIEGAGLAGCTLLFGGTEAQKREWIPRISRGKAWFAFGMTDRGPGSDPVSMATRAVKTKGGYRIRGQKRLISNCDIATHLLLLAKSDPLKGARGISAFLLEKDTPGLKFEQMRGHGDVEHHVFRVSADCEVGPEALLGGEGEGFIAALKSMDRGRVGLAAASVGLARAAWEMAVAHAKRRVVFGRPLKEYQAVSFPLAELAIQIDAARFLVHRAAWLDDRGLRHSTETAMAKYAAGEAAAAATETLMRVLGGLGWSKESPAGRWLMDAKTANYGQGSQDIQKLIISRAIFEEKAQSRRR